MTAIDVTREWLKAGATAKGDSPLVETIMPLLHVSNTYPIALNPSDR
jgi:protein phosphatase 1 regulatory subunit 10